MDTCSASSTAMLGKNRRVVVAVLILANALAGCDKSTYLKTSAQQTGDPNSPSANGGADGAGGSNGSSGAGSGTGSVATPPSQVSCVLLTIFPGYWRTQAAETFSFLCNTSVPGASVVSTECQVDSAPWAPCQQSGSHALSGLAEGAHSFRVRATDSKGNSGQSAVLSWAVDTNAPVMNGLSYSNVTPASVQLAFSATDSGSGVFKFQCRFSSGRTSWEDCVVPQTYGGLTAGTTYTAYVRSVDHAGNVEGTPREITFQTATSVLACYCSIL